MKLPSQIKVGGHSYKIELVPNYWREGGNYGDAFHELHIIKMDSSLSEENLNVTFWHELLHCVDRVYNNHQCSEDLIEHFAQGLFQVLSDMGIKFE